MRSDLGMTGIGVAIYLTSVGSDMGLGVFIQDNLSNVLCLCNLWSSTRFGFRSNIVLMYIINDIVFSSSKLNFTLFDDDTSLFVQDKNPLVFENNINTGLVEISDWLIPNKLTLNIDKSNLLLFKSHRIEGCVNLSIYINGKELK